MIKFLRRILAFVAVVALLVVLGMLVPRPLLAANEEMSPSRRILLLTNPIHTDIAIPLDADVVARFAFLEGDGVPITSPAARWLIVGWGGRAFYLETPTWADLKPLPVLKAFTVDRSVIHVDVTAGIDEAHPAVTVLDVSEEGVQRLLAFIDASFAQSEGLPQVIAGAGYGPTDRFYEARGYFNAFLGCNTWTARALREAGFKTGWWNPLPPSLAVSLRLHNAP